jgi:Cu+-exporting ATPase
MVYHLLQDHGMGDYYRFENTPGISQNKDLDISYAYLDNDEIKQKLLSFNEGSISKISFIIPQIHCSSCLWLLENIGLLNNAVTNSVVNFSAKKATITYNNKETNLRALVELLAKIGYEPKINYNLLDGEEEAPSFDKVLMYKLGLAGFCFGNIMLLSFPEYLGFDKASYLFHIGYINIFLALPVLFYAGWDYIKSAFRGLKYKEYSIDLPIAIGMIALFSRSVFEILSHSGEGYLDSFAGFVFFLLIGRWFQAFTYKSLDFERNYKSYFPISANIKSNNAWVSKGLDDIVPGDVILVRNEEIVPTDGILRKGKARINYSFVTGESELLSKSTGDEIFAGGKQQGKSIEVLVTKKVNQSYLTQLWNEDAFQSKEESQSTKIIATISKYFTFGVIGIALATMLFWYFVDIGLAINAFTAVLIVACPCALALAIPFTYGNILRLFTGNGIFLKNVNTIEHIQDIDYIIFDKTGTITDSNKMEVSYLGKSLSTDQKSYIKSVCTHSSHPLSIAIVNYLSNEAVLDIDAFRDDIGLGLTASCAGHKIKIGSAPYIFGSQDPMENKGVFIEIDGVYFGYFAFKHAFRTGLQKVMKSITQKYKVAILSGDSDQHSDSVREMIGDGAEMHFNKSPKEKLEKVKELQGKGYKVMMIGDGLNDAGALKQAHVGLVISDEVNNFSPACDGIINSSQFENLSTYFRYLKNAKRIIYGAFVLAILYNGIGLCFAISGQLSPVIAAILMPLSSITIIIYGVAMSWFLFWKFNLNSTKQ